MKAYHSDYYGNFFSEKYTECTEYSLKNFKMMQ